MMRKRFVRGAGGMSSREINPSYIRRAESVSSADAPAHLDSIAISLHQALDNWRYNGGPKDEVTLCLDAMVALWTVVERRQVDE